MGSVLIEMLPLILGAIFAPAWVIIVFLLLGSPQGIAKASAFVGGMTFTRLMQGLIFGAIMWASSSNDKSDGGSSPVVSTLLLVVGILLLTTGVRKAFKEEDPDAPPPKWMESLGELPPLKAFGFGALLVGIAPKQLVFTLSALAIIGSADLTLTTAAIAFLLYIVLAQIVLLTTILISIIAPQVASQILQRANDLLAEHSRIITVVVTVIFGGYFMWNGIKGLLAAT